MNNLLVRLPFSIFTFVIVWYLLGVFDYRVVRAFLISPIGIVFLICLTGLMVYVGFKVFKKTD